MCDYVTEAKISHISTIVLAVTLVVCNNSTGYNFIPIKGDIIKQASKGMQSLMVEVAQSRMKMTDARG